MRPDPEMLKVGWHCLCPRCQKASIYETKFSMDQRDTCPECGLDLSKSDSADGPAVFLIFILGLIIVPAALILDALIPIPFWLNVLGWTTVALICTLLSLRPIKAYVIALQYKHLPWDKKDEPET